MSPNDTNGGGGLKKCPVLFEWPLIVLIEKKMRLFLSYFIIPFINAIIFKTIKKSKGHS